MIFDDFKRDEENKVIAVCGDKEFLLPEEYIVAYKPQIGDEFVEPEPVVEAPAKTVEPEVK